jgi:formate hydrogenlyase transcriptional activator
MDRNNSSLPGITLMIAAGSQETETTTPLFTWNQEQCEPVSDIFHGLFEKAPDAVLVSDCEGKILFLNTQTEKLFGYSRTELQGQPLEVLMPERFRRCHASQRSSYASAPTFRQMGAGLDLYGLRKDGSEFPVEIGLSPLRTPTGMVFASTVRDVTYRKHVEMLLHSQLQFEKMVAQLTFMFLHVTTEEMRNKINETLKIIAEDMGFDRVCLRRLDSATNKLMVLSIWARPGITGVKFKVANDHCPWLAQQMLAGAAVHVSTPNELPLEAAADREYMLSIGEQSLLAIPLSIGSEVIGAISFDTFREQQKWEPLLISRLQQIAAVFSNVLARERAEEHLQVAYSRIEELNKRLEQENLCLRQGTRIEHSDSNFIGQSVAIRNILKQAEQVAMTDSAVLIQGETGTGKELLARTIHELSSRKSRPMVKINCAALPPTLIESELFGREKGAYTGALTREIGRFELADKSTIFLDEVGDLPTELQVKLLRVLQEGEFERLGSPKTLHVDVRVIAATNRDLAVAVAEGKFREDLYYRLGVFPIHVPPLRERPEDIQELVWHILQDLGNRMGKTIRSIQLSTMKAFQSYSWPGNVRELRNVIERNLILNSGPVFRAQLPEAYTRTANPGKTHIEEIERDHILLILRSTAWRIRGQHGAALLLGLKPTTLESRMKKLNIQRCN